MVGQWENPMDLHDGLIGQGSSSRDAGNSLFIFNALCLCVCQDNERRRADNSNRHNNEEYGFRPSNPKRRWDQR